MAEVAAAALAQEEVLPGEPPLSLPNERIKTGVAADVRLYYQASRMVEHLQTFIGVAFTGVSLGALSDRRRYAIDRVYYDRERMYHTARWNEQGWFDWEEPVINKYFGDCTQLLVACAGGGREVIALRRMGVDAVGFECHPELAAFADALLERLGFGPDMRLAARDECPNFGTSFTGAVVGWSGYMLIRSRARRVAFLRRLRSQMVGGAPVLLSFVTRSRSARSFAAAAAIANGLRHLLGGERAEVGDFLVPNFVHFFTRDEIERELKEAGFELAFFSPTPYGHAVGHVR